MRRFIVDAGPLVAYLSARDRYHTWAKHAFASVTPPLLTCEAVLVESWHLLRATSHGQEALLELLAQGLLDPDFAVKAEVTAIRQLTKRYRDRPMSLHDQQAYDVAAFILSHRRPDTAGKELDWPNGDPPEDAAYATRAGRKAPAAAH